MSRADASFAASEPLATVMESLWASLAHAPWADWRDFWARQLLDDRFMVVYFLPLLPVLMAFPRAYLRHGIVLTALVFLGYVFGVAYPLLWLLTCVAFYALAERFAYDLRSGRVPRWWPPLAAGLLIGGWFLGTMLLRKAALPTELNAWLFEHLPWLFPLGARPFTWEPYWIPLPGAGPDARPSPPLLFTLLWNPHNIGTAYFAVRMLTYFTDIRRGRIPPEQRGLLRFLAWVSYAPTLMQGPIERYPEFQAEMDVCHTRRGWRNVPPAFARIGLGVLKSFVSLAYFTPLLASLGIGVPGNPYFEHPERVESYLLLYLGPFLTIFTLYLEFSGYCDVSAGMARLLGYRQIENFRNPWFATSLRDFWHRWHISLSSILRDYVYIPFGGNRRHKTLNLCVTFAVCGLWHVPSPAMGLWGVVMGLMMMVEQGWSRAMDRLEQRPASMLAAFRRAWQRLGPAPVLLAWFVTMNAFCLSLLIFFGGSGALRVAWELLRRPLGWSSGAPE